MQAYESGDYQTAASFQQKIQEADGSIYRTPSNPQVGVKIALKTLGVISNSLMRHPNGQADKVSKRKIKNFLDDFDHK